MKKIIAIIMTICLMVLSLVSCGNKTTAPTTATTGTTSMPEAPADAKEEKYLTAFEMLNQKNYEAAYALFTELGDYKDAAKEAAYFRYMPTVHCVEYIHDEGEESVTYTVTLNDKNLPETIVEEYASGFKHTCKITYNDFGSVTRRECTDTEGATTLYEATYDANGKVLGDIFTDKDGNVSKFECMYNEKGEVFKVVTTNVPGYYLSYVCTYDAEGREIKVVYEFDYGTDIEETTYNEAGKILKKSWAKDGEIYSVDNYKYDEKGRLTEILFTEYGEDVGFIKMTYDDKDQMLTEHVLYADGYEYTCSYEYDDHGNVIKTIYDVANGEVGDEVVESTYKLVYVPYEYSEDDWMNICDSTQCWDWSHMIID